MNFSYIDKIDTNSPTIILARHAERFKVDKLQGHEQVLLTGNGINDARLFGEHIAERFDNVKIFHSPVMRCRQTAENIFSGLTGRNRNAALEGEQQWLAGQYLLDLNYIDNYIREQGINDFLRAWFDGKLSAGIVTPVKEIAMKQLAELCEQLNSNEGLTIDITHDWDMSVFLEYYLKLRHEDIGTPGFLEHIIISNSSGRISLSYRDNAIEI